MSKPQEFVRNEKATCDNCPYWQATSGQCRSTSPCSLSLETPEAVCTIMWPETGHNQWCGNHPQFQLWKEARR